MNMRLKKTLKRCIIDIISNKYRYLCVSVVLFVALMFFSHLGEVLFKASVGDGNDYQYCGEPIDVVYTWVNGSDPEFQSSLKKYLREDHDLSDFSDARFNDKYELKFSLRSLEKFAPWVRHVYIVTNGQIPYWLNLDEERVRLVSHEDIFTDPENLPTFSSPAIESHIHRIPGLSKRFIYFNDDIFLGVPTYPEDFFSPNLGYLIYLAWWLPNCTPDCPWAFVGDEQCDPYCNNRPCQYDGGDCSTQTKRKRHPRDNTPDYEESEENYEYYESAHQNDHKNIIKRSVMTEIDLENNETTNGVKISKFQSKMNNFTLTDKLSNSLINNRNLLNISELVSKHNREIISDNQLRRRKVHKSFRKHKKFYRERFSNSTNHTKTFNGYEVFSGPMRSGPHLNSHTLSLQHTNRIFNKAYGFQLRKVPAHSPIMVERPLMEELQQKFWREFRLTAANRLRSPDDMQFSFSYYYYLIGERRTQSVSEIFDQFDTDGSQTWSDREIRSVLARLNELPLTYSMVDFFDETVINCSKVVQVPDVTVPPYERYIDSKLPTISKDLVMLCPVLVEILLERFGSVPRFKYDIVKNVPAKHVTFHMLLSNVSNVVGHLDEIRKNPRKFICLNDDLDPKKSEENELVKAILLDFYLSLFPAPSRFELPPEYRNRFSTVGELRAWRDHHVRLKLILLLFFITIIVFSFRQMCKRRVTRQIKRYIYF